MTTTPMKPPQPPPDKDAKESGRRLRASSSRRDLDATAGVGSNDPWPSLIIDDIDHNSESFSRFTQQAVGKDKSFGTGILLKSVGSSCIC